MVVGWGIGGDGGMGMGCGWVGKSIMLTRIRSPSRSLSVGVVSAGLVGR